MAFLLMMPYAAIVGPLHWLIPEWQRIYFAIIKHWWLLCAILVSLPCLLLKAKKLRRKLVYIPLAIYSLAVLLLFSPILGGNDALLFFTRESNYRRVEIDGKGTYYVAPECDWLDGVFKGNVLYKRNSWLPTMKFVETSGCVIEFPGNPTTQYIQVSERHEQCDHENEPCKEMFQE